MQTQNRTKSSMAAENAADDTSYTQEAHDRLDQAASKAHATVDRVHRRATNLSDQFASQGGRTYQQACAWVTEHPMQAIGGALAIGYLFGRLRS
jgi:ElaB/YqjD/DUF883 family membrane-anchored ribosome-binding protein